MALDWQTAVSLVAVVAAAGYLIHEVIVGVRERKTGGSGAGGCSGCPSAGVTGDAPRVQTNLVSLTLPDAR